MLTSDELGRLLAVAEAEFAASYPLVLFLADTGARLHEALALRWSDVDLKRRTARIRHTFSDGQYLWSPQRQAASALWSFRRACEQNSRCAGRTCSAKTLVFPSRDGGLLDPHNFRARVFDSLVRKVLGLDRRFSPHGLRHTFATLHLARGTSIKWIQAQGGWSRAKLLLDWYGHFLPCEQHGFADALSTALDGAQTALGSRRTMLPKRTEREYKHRRGIAWRPGQDSNLRPVA